MPAQHDPHNHQVSVKFPHTTWRQIEKCAEESAMTPGQYIRDVVTLRVANTPLTSADLRTIADRVAQAERKGGMV